jgi:hypothetical protein
MTTPLTFLTLLQQFFSEHLRAHRQASPRTIASYRDAFRLLLTYAQAQLHKPGLGGDLDRSGRAADPRVSRSSRNGSPQ